MNEHIGGYVTRIRAEMGGNNEVWTECATRCGITVGRTLGPTEGTSGTQEWIVG